MHDFRAIDLVSGLNLIARYGHSSVRLDHLGSDLNDGLENLIS